MTLRRMREAEAGGASFGRSDLIDRIEHARE
jgi:hypothetical protein